MAFSVPFPMLRVTWPICLLTSIETELKTLLEFGSVLKIAQLMVEAVNLEHVSTQWSKEWTMVPAQTIYAIFPSSCLKRCTFFEARTTQNRIRSMNYQMLKSYKKFKWLNSFSFLFEITNCLLITNSLVTNRTNFFN